MLSKLVANRTLSSFSAPSVQRLFAVTQLTDKRGVSTAEYQRSNPLTESYQSYFTHNPVEGFIRNSPYDVVQTPNLALDQYVWQNVAKWPNHIATVSDRLQNNSFMIKFNYCISQSPDAARS